VKLRVLSWNIHKGIGGVDRRYRPERVIEVIAHYEPDLVLLQEVDDGVPRSRFDRQIDLLGEALGLRHRTYGPNVHLRGGGRYGNATLSRWPFTDVGNIDLTIKPKKRRGALYARCRVRRGRRSRTIAIFNLHLGLAGFERKMQLRRFMQSQPFAGLHHRTPIVLGGDFNDVYGTLGPKVLEPAGFRASGPPASTYPAIYPVRALDGLYVRGDLDCVRCARSRLRLTREASDHLPLIAEIELSWARSGQRG
jgi:endonuclease/exonuclease/phosphatase family metal-dependent hydrolase